MKKTRTEKLQQKVDGNQSALHSWLRHARILCPGEIAAVEVSVRIRDRNDTREDTRSMVPLTDTDWQEIVAIDWPDKKIKRVVEDLKAWGNGAVMTVDFSIVASVNDHLKKKRKPYALMCNHPGSYQFRKITGDPCSFVATSTIEA